MSSDLRSTFDGRSIGAYRAAAAGERRGGVVVVQEIFGVSAHIRERCDAFAAAGYDAIAPSIFDRIEAGFQAPLDAAGLQKGRAAVDASPWEQVAGDVQAAIDALAPPVFVTGFCYGGAVTWLAAARCRGVTAASAFYGRLINSLLDDAPRVPIVLHYGERDPSIPAAAVAQVRERYPGVPVHLYPAGHGFCRRGSADYDPGSCVLATERTLAFFASALA
ncbi:MAG: dienelactone hydrolase family protein [Deltaproteobacteria bacterium]|nr:dienelactone hydrolase family protein [Kofleriaceae bacterium]